MKNIVLFSFVIIFSCATSDRIYREIRPNKQHETTAVVMKDKIILEKNKVTVQVEPIYGRRLERWRKSHVELFGGKTPLLMIFQVVIKNDNKTRIHVPLKKVVLLDDLKNQYPVLTYEDYIEIYPTKYYNASQYSSVYRRYEPYTYNLKNSEKRLSMRRSLFRGGYIFPGYQVKSFITFEHVPGESKYLEICFPDIEILKNTEETSGKSKIKENFYFAFQHHVIRNLNDH